MFEKCFERARKFVYRNARPIDLALWKYHFENGNKDDVLTALAAYQNADGGFAHAIEPDFWNENSTPIATWAATCKLEQMGGVDRSHPIVAMACRAITPPSALRGLPSSTLTRAANCTKKRALSQNRRSSGLSAAGKSRGILWYALWNCTSI